MIKLDSEKRKYEVSFFTREESGAGAVYEIISKMGGEIIFKSPVVGTELSYPMKKFAKGYFGFAQFSIEPQGVSSVNKSLGLNDNILRSLVFSLSEKKDKNTVDQQNRSVSRTKRPATVLQHRESRSISNEALEEEIDKLADK